MKKLFIKSLFSSFVFIVGVLVFGFLVLKVMAGITNVSSGSPLTADMWNDMVSQVFQKNGNNLYYMTGNVGIGTTNPTSKIDVINGNIKVSGFKVSSYVGEAMQNVVFAINDLAWTDVPGVVININLDSEKLINLRSYGSVTAGAPVGANTYTHCGYRFNVDGIGYGHSSWGDIIVAANGSTTPGWRNPFYLERNISLSAGSHTIKVQGIGRGTSYPKCTIEANDYSKIKLFVETR